MRVLDVDNNYSPSGGGVRTYHEEKLAWFREHYEGDYAFVVPSDRSERIVSANTTVYHVPAVPLGGSGYRFIVSRRELTRVFQDFRPDVAEIGSPYVLPKLVARANRRTRAATVGFYHSDVPDTVVRPLAARFGAHAETRGTGAASRWIGRTYRGMTGVFAASRFVLEKLADAGVTRLFHTPLGVDLDVHRPERRSAAWRADLGIGESEILVLYMARIAPEKGIRRLFDSYPAWRNPGRVRLVIAGHGPLEGELETFCGRFPEVVRLPYMSERADVARAYASADVFLSLGALETFSLATAEALASGTPTVAPTEGGAGEQVEQVTPELLFDPDDAASLSGAIERACRMDAVARSRMRAFAEHGRGWAGVFAREVSYYRRIVDAHRRNDLGPLEPASGRWHATTSSERHD